MEKQNIFIEAFQTVLGTKKGYKKRLLELQKWDKPFCQRDHDPNGQWICYDKKIEALQYLIENN